VNFYGQQVEGVAPEQGSWRRRSWSVLASVRSNAVVNVYSALSVLMRTSEGVSDLRGLAISACPCMSLRPEQIGKIAVGGEVWRTGEGI
jgi:hypothetical protein